MARKPQQIPPPEIVPPQTDDGWQAVVDAFARLLIALGKQEAKQHGG